MRVTRDVGRTTAGATAAPVIVDDVAVAIGGRMVLREVSTHVAAGEVVALLGANGSGKSTLVRTIVGLLSPHRGTVRVFGSPVSQLSDRRRIGYVPQRLTAASAVPATVAEVVHAGRLAGRPWWRPVSRADVEAVDRALQTVGLADRARDGVAELSGGQQQRVLLARALAGDPDLLILDEPMAGVDLDSQESVSASLATLVRAGTTVLLVAHELGPVETLVDRAVVLRDGRVVHDGAPPAPAGHHSRLGHDHVHQHADEPTRPGWVH